MVATRSTPAYEMRDYGELLRRRKLIILVLTVLGLTGGLIALRVLPKTYTATASVLVSSTTVADAQVAGGRTSSDINLDTESQLVTSFGVAGLAAKELHTKDSPSTLVGNVTVTVPPNTQVLTIGYDAPDPRSARRGAHAFAQAYLSNRADVSQKTVAAQVKNLTAQQAAANTSLTQFSTKAAGLPSNSPEKVAIQAQVTRLTAALANIDGSLSRLTSSPITPGTIISDATEPADPSQPNPLIVISAGLLGGLLLGLLVGLLRDRTDKRVRSSIDVERLIDVTLLAEVPGRKLHTTSGASLVTQDGAVGAAIARLRNTITADLGPNRRVLLVVGASEGRSSDFLAHNLAGSLARAGFKCTLMMANLRDTHAPEATERLGVSDFLLHHLSASELAQPSADLQSLNIVGPGTQAELAANRLQTDKARELVAGLLANVNYVVILASSTSTSADAQTLAQLADGVIIVAELGSTRKTQLIDAERQLLRVGARIMGAVVVPRVTRRGNGARRAAATTSRRDPSDSSGPRDFSQRRLNEVLSRPGPPNSSVSDGGLPIGQWSSTPEQSAVSRPREP